MVEQSNEELILSFLADGGDDFTSGETLSDKLGLSRTAVWKHVESLRGRGYRIDAVPTRGYRLVEIPDRLSALELAPLLLTRELGQTLHYEEKVTSTNEWAWALANEGATHGEVVVCEQQTAGKGRRGRSWVSPFGVNLYCSVILRPELPPQRAPELTLLAAVAVAETLQDVGVDASIKWPNDLEIRGRKVAGILTELSAEADRIHHVILGIGVNVNALESDFPEDLRESATSLRLVRGESVPRALFAAALWTRLEGWLDTHADEGFEPIRAAWRRLSNTLGQSVLVKTDDKEWIGIARDIDEQGALLVSTSDGREERVLAGDVQTLRARHSSSDS